MVSAKHTIQPLRSARQTASEMERIVRTYSTDLGPKVKWTLPRIYRHVRDLPFRPDPPGAETVSRPAFTLQRNYPWRDCDDKAVILGSWCYQNNIPFYFKASSKHPSGRLHHVYAVCRVLGKEIPLDATYPRNRLGKEEPHTKTEKLSGDIRMNTLNTLEGDYDQELLGSVFSRVKKGIKKTVGTPRRAMMTAATPFAFAPRVAYHAFTAKKSGSGKSPAQIASQFSEAKKYKALQEAIKKAGKISGKISLSLPGTLNGYDDEELGAWYSNLGRKVKNVGKKVGKTAYRGGKSLASSSAVQAGLNAYLPGSGTALASLVGKGPRQAVSDMGTAMQDKQFVMRWAKTGAMVGAAGIVLYLLLRRK